jgi:predicted nucleotidyltransferase component of viral defense system
MLNELVEAALRDNEQLNGLADAVEKELLLHDILNVLHQEGILQNLTFIGGTSLRLCYRSSRLSEDLDFTAGSDFIPSYLTGMGEHLRKYLETKYGLNVAVHEPMLSDSDTSTWKVTLEKHPSQKDLPSQKMHIDICALPSFDRIFRPVFNHYGLPSPIAGLPIPVQSQQEILADKMVAFAFRKRRIKPRDVWDIVWLKQNGIEQDVELIQKKLAVREKSLEDYMALTRKHADMIIAHSETKRDFEQEMGRFLPKDVAQRTLLQPMFWPYVGETVKTEVEQIITGLTNQKPRFNMKM